MAVPIHIGATYWFRLYTIQRLAGKLQKWDAVLSTDGRVRIPLFQEEGRSEMDIVRISIHVSSAELCDGVLDTGQLEQYISLYR